MKRGNWMRAGLCLLAAAVDLVAAEPPRPNIVFLMADDLGWGDFQCYNPQGKVPTPNLDRIAREGMRFTDAHTPAALCAPTRYAVATGNYTWRGRQPGGTWGWNQAPQFLPGQKTVGHLLQEAGYRTGLFGKLHFGGVFEMAGGKADFTKPMKVGPREWGFTCSYVLLGGHQAPPYCFFEDNRVDGDPAKIVPLEPGPLNGGAVTHPGPGLPDWDSRQVGPKLIEKALAFIDADRTKPFYIHLSTDGAHGPYTPPDEIRGTPVKGVTKMTDKTDMAYEFDVVVGKFMEELDRRGLLSNTLIVVTSDNGGIPTDREAHGHDAVGGLRGAKSQIWEGGHRVPFLALWPGHVPAGAVRDQVIGTHDIVPTFVELAGGRFAADQMLDSVSLAPVLLGQRGDDQPVRETLLIQSSPGRDALTEGKKGKPAKAAPGEKLTPAERERQRNQALNQVARKGAKSGSHGMAHALREGPWKLVFDIEHNAPAALYNLADDLGERKNLIADPAQAERIQRMEKRYREIRSSKRSTPVPAA
jgi:arylsulfatase A